MMTKKTIGLLVVMALVIAAGIAAVSAFANDSAVNVDSGAAGISAEQAKQTAEKETGGVAAAVETDDENGTLIYEVRVDS